MTVRCGVLLALVLACGARPALAQCSYSVSPSSVSAPSTGTVGTVSVITGSSCAWTMVSSVSWITVTRGASSQGLASADYAVAANTTGAVRVGTLTVAGRTVTVTQAASSCTYSVSPTSLTAPINGTVGTIPVITGSNCAWTAVSTVSWITITRGASSMGLGSTDFTVAPTTLQRVGTMIIAGHTVTITQDGRRPPSAPTGFRIVR
jgi:hypothetical protein